MKTTIKIIGIILLSFLLSFIPNNTNSIITLDSLSNWSIDLFSVSLAIIALLFTILDRYKENLSFEKKEQLLSNSYPIIKNMGSDSISILILIISIFLYDIVIPLFSKIQNSKFLSYINFHRFILLLILIFLISITIDITVSIMLLINGFMKINKSSSDIQLSLAEQELILVSRKLNKKYFNELLNYIKSLVVRQEIEK